MLRENLKIIRNKRGYTFKKLSKKTGVSMSTLMNIENGRNDNPKLSVLIAISKALRISVDKLIK